MNVAKLWVNLLFQEFFHQGDIQKKDSLPLSMMCDRDRNVTYIPKTQPGFIAFASLPLLTAISIIVPETTFIKEQLLRNKE